MSAAGADEHLEISNFIRFQDLRHRNIWDIYAGVEKRREVIEIQKGFDIWDPTDITWYYLKLLI